MGCLWQNRNGRALASTPKSYFLTIIHMIRGNGATPQGSRILASLAILAVATVCVVLVVDTETTGDMTLESTRPAAEQKASTSVSATKPGAPATKLVQIPMILASDEDMRRAIYAKERKAAKAKEVRHKKHQEDRREHQAAQKARKQRQRGAPEDCQDQQGRQARQEEGRPQSEESQTQGTQEGSTQGEESQACRSQAGQESQSQGKAQGG